LLLSIIKLFMGLLSVNNTRPQNRLCAFLYLRIQENIKNFLNEHFNLQEII
jgi:hypothetical protein